MANTLTLDNGLPVLFSKGYAINQNVEVVVNSANNGLLLGGSGALAIKDATGPQLNHASELCSDAELVEKFNRAYEELKVLGDKCGKYVGEVCKSWIKMDYEIDPKKGKRKSIVKETYVQLECLYRIIQNGGMPFELGSAVLTSSGKDFEKDISKPRAIIHAIGMGYDLFKLKKDEKTGKTKYSKGEMEFATHSTVTRALENSFAIIAREGYKSVSLPLMCVRDGYSEKGKDETEAEKEERIRRTCMEFDYITMGVISVLAPKTKLERIVYCADNDVSVERFEKLGRL